MGDYDSLTQLSYMSSDNVINIYVVENILSSLSGKVLGYATRPESKTKENIIVVCYDYFGDYAIIGSPLAGISTGMVLAHEVGHYLGLYHPFTGGCTGLDNNNCKTKGDLCCDVPAVATENRVCPSYTVNTCTEKYNGDPADLKENIMDYGDHSCQNMFTPDQTDIMHTVLTTLRYTLIDVNNINNLKLACCEIKPNFGGTDMLCFGDSTQFSGIKYKPNSTYIWRFYLKGVLKKTVTDTFNTVWITPSDTGRYDIEMVAIVDSLRDSVYKSKYMLVRTCGQSIASANGNWYFGKWAGIKFAPSGPYRDLGPYINRPPKVKQINALEGTISQSNARGQLLFYGGANENDSLNFRMYDKNYQEMEGSPLIGDWTAGMGAVVIPFINDTNKYYIFHLVGGTNQDGNNWNPSQNYMRYSVVDMNITSTTIGKVFLKNIFLKDSLNHRIKTKSEAVIMAKRTGTLGYWLIFEGIDSTNGYRYFYEYAVDATGIHYHKKQSSLHPILYFDEIMKISPDGNFLLLGNYIYRFNSANGDIKLWSIIGDIKENYGFSFSPNSRKIYTTVNRIESWVHNFYLERYDLFSSVNPQVPDYSRQIKSIKAIQIGPDNKMYLSAYRQPFISLIENPNENNPSLIDYKEEGVTIGSSGVGGISNLGLPNINDAINPDTSVGIEVLITGCTEYKFMPYGRIAINYKWLFGDGDSSLEKYPIHTYTDTGNYEVVLITEYDTIFKTINVGIGTQKAEILGDNHFCDSMVNYEYSAPLYNMFSYNWSVTNAKAFYIVGNVLLANWSDTGSIKLIMINLKSGCKDSTNLEILPGEIPSNNIIPDNFIMCDSINTISIEGEVPVVYGTGYNFQWYYYNQTNSKWQKIDSATRKDFNPHKLKNNTFLFRQVNQNGCRNNSEICNLGIINSTNNITLVKHLCFKGDTIRIQGDTTYGNINTYISWQYSINGTDWNYYNINSESLVTAMQYDSIYIRRLVDYLNYCEIASNIIKIYPDVTITEQPKPQYVCSFGQFNFKIKVKNRRGYPLVYWWRHKDSISGWSLHIGKDSVSDYAVYSTSSDSFQCVVQTPCGYIYSDKVLLKVRNSGPEIDLDPSNQNLNEGELTNLAGGVFNPYEVGLKYGWQYRIDRRTYNSMSKNSIYGGWDYKQPQWINVVGASKDTLAFITGICDDSVEYRFVANNGCTSYSYPARIFVNHQADLWMKDSYMDTGAEPNRFVAGWSNPSQRTVDIFKSPDIYNCKISPGCSSPENAEFKNYGNNYVNFTIRNRGISTSKTAKLYLYWTLASTGEIWDKSWKSPSDIRWYDPTYWTSSEGYYHTKYSRFYNIDSSKFYPTGGQINPTGIVIPELDTGVTYSSYYAWQPPNPRWFYTIVNNNHFYVPTLNICLYGRIEYCDEYPHKMSTAELYRVSVDTNVINNNNIATHNLWLRDDEKNKREYPYHPVWTSIDQPCDSNTSAPISLYFDALNPMFYTTGQVIATLDDALWNSWYGGGMVGTGILPLDSQRIQITDVNAVLGNIYSDSCNIGNIGFEFFPLDTNSIPADTSLFSLSQINEETGLYQGGTLFQVEFNTDTSQAGGEAITLTTKKQYIQAIKKVHYMIYPNPANTKLTIYINAEPQTEHSIKITDVTGKVLLTETCQLSQKETYTKQIDISNLSVGTYFICISSNYKTEVKKFNILR